MPDREPTPMRSPELLGRGTSRLVIVDMQERLLNAMQEGTQVIAKCEKLIRAAQILDVPVDATEQYPKGLGPTVPKLRELLAAPIEKLRFSCAESLPWIDDASAREERDQIVVAGIETHVCVLQTALDLIGCGFRVIIPADAVTSRKPIDRDFGLKRLADQGVTVTTTEAILFEWCEVAGTPEFKQISQLVKDA